MDDNLLNRLRELPTTAPAADHPAPVAGQLWRAEWHSGSDEAACLVVVMVDCSYGEREVDVVPVSVHDAGDDKCTVVDTTNGFSATAWAGLRRHIYKFTLGHRIGDLSEASENHLRTVASGNARSDWPPIVDVLDDRVLERADLQDRLEFLSSADWAAATDSSGRSVDDLATAAGVSNTDIATALGIAPGDAQRLRKGGRAARPEEVAALTNLLGEAPRTEISFDAALLAQMDEPELRPRLDAHAADRYGSDPIATRRHVAERVMATQFRQQEPGAPNWKQAILDALAED